MTIIKNATQEELKIIKKRLKQSKLTKNVDEIIIINDFVNTLEKFYGVCIISIQNSKTKIIISSIDFISKNPDAPFDFDTIVCHELGHVNNKQYCDYTEYLLKNYPKIDKEFYELFLELYAYIFHDALKSNEKINKKEILREAKQTIQILVDEVRKGFKEVNSQDILYNPNGFTIISGEEAKIIKNHFKIVRLK